MLRKIVTISLVIILTGLLGGAYIHFSSLKNFKNNDTVKAIPTDASLIIQVQKPEDIIDIILNDITYKEDLSSFDFITDFVTLLQTVHTDSLINSAKLNSFKRKAISISLHPVGKDNVYPLFTYSLNNKAEQNELHDFIEERLTEWNGNKRKYNTSDIYSIPIKSSDINVYLSTYRGILVASSNSLLVENSLRQLRADISLLDDKNFCKLLKTAGNNTDANLLVNLDNLPQVISPLLKKPFKKYADVFSKIANWGEFDINLNKDHVLINGFLYSDDSNAKIESLFKGINANKSGINEILPDNTDFILSYSFNNSDKLRKNQHKYLSKTNALSALNDRLTKLNLTVSNEKIKEAVFDMIDEEFAFTINNSGNASYLAINTDSKSKTLKLISEFSGEDIKPFYNYKLDNETQYPIYKNNAAKVFPVILDVFCPDAPDKLFAFVDNYIVFANTPKALSEFIYSNVLNKTLNNSNYHQQFKDKFAYKDNVFIYCDISKTKELIPGSSDFELLNPSKSQTEALSDFYGFGIQMNTTNDQLYLNACLSYLPEREREPETVWQSGLDSTIIGKPSLVKNHNTKETEIMVQDKSNMLYLISNSGRVLWKKKLEAPILSEIVQIDYYRNNKLQYLFNTENKIYLIDRNGNGVDRFPVALAHKATNGISVFDYDKNRNYRIFIACNNHKTYVYDKSGKIVTGWKAEPTEGKVTQAIQHFRIQGKDYIVFADDKRNYILNRRGEHRVDIKSDFVSNQNSSFYLLIENNIPYLTITDIKGNLQKISLKDGNCKQEKLIDSEENHYFAAKNISSTKGIESIIVTKDKLRIFSAQGKELSEVETEGNLSLNADIYTFSGNNIKIGVYDAENNKIYLVNNNGSIYKNFPLRGKSRFSIGFMNTNSAKFNLIVGGENNYLYNYKVE